MLLGRRVGGPGTCCTPLLDALRKRGCVALGVNQYGLSQHRSFFQLTRPRFLEIDSDWFLWDVGGTATPRTDRVSRLLSEGALGHIPVTSSIRVMILMALGIFAQGGLYYRWRAGGRSPGP